MKVYCKASFIDVNVNFFKILGAGYGESYLKWQEGKVYNARLGNTYESIGEQYIDIETENTGYSSCLGKKIFNKHFMTIEDVRDEKIKQILK